MLDERLKKIADHIKGNILVDIGSDHAYLPIYAIKNNIVTHAICGEIVKGPFDSTIKNIETHSLTEKIEARFGSGLEVLTHEDDIDTITICGMGGPLIADILKSGFKNVKDRPRLILQPNIYSYPVRKTLADSGYSIIDETVIKDGRHFYEIIVAEDGDADYDKKDLTFGPVNLQKREMVFMQKLEREREHQKRILANLEINSGNQEKINEIREFINLLEEVL